MKMGGFSLLDTQFITGHLARFGAIEIPAERYRHVLDAALEHEANFYPAALDAQLLPRPQEGGVTTSEVCLQVLSQIS